VIVFLTILFRLLFGGKKPVSSETFFMFIHSHGCIYHSQLCS
jgi:hypothetical protein